jgi:hypothetical protein
MATERARATLVQVRLQRVLVGVAVDGEVHG